MESREKKKHDSMLGGISLYRLVYSLISMVHMLVCSFLGINQQVLAELQRFVVKPKNDLLLKFIDCEMPHNTTRDQQEEGPSSWDFSNYKLSSSASLRLSAYIQPAKLVDSTSLDRFEYFFRLRIRFRS
jgi:hypothetical protein